MRPAAASAFLVLLFSSALAATAAEPSSAVELSPVMTAWKQEIEERGSRKVVLVRVYTDPERNVLILPADAGHRPLLVAYFQSPAFVEQLAAAHALTVNYESPEGAYHFVLLNMARSRDWEGAEDGLLGHEFGHVWLHALGYPSPVYTPGPESCLQIQAGDIVQHILIRQEMRRRCVPYLDYWLPNLDTALDQLERQAGQTSVVPIPLCQRLAQLTLWMDVRLGLSENLWDRYPCFLDAMRQNFREHEPHVEALTQTLRDLDLKDRQTYSQALERVLDELRSIAVRVP